MHSVNYIDLSEEDIMKQRFPYLKLDDRDHPFFDDDGAGYVKARAMVEAQKKVAHKQGCHIVDDIVEEVKDFKDGAHEVFSLQYLHFSWKSELLIIVSVKYSEVLFSLIKI
ncbi:hypothetical protein AVEN_229888-1 [Araneus ventricosus]|uniref:Uncharacterized protein n=1 Tax=Araneus ventricosus TaxID=182803 RepID=A0A4Y2USC3_ARAVE|nr:hypothetical protein AVEN_229888-1 [Araneus ventricosus]